MRSCGNTCAAVSMHLNLLLKHTFIRIYGRIPCIAFHFDCYPIHYRMHLRTTQVFASFMLLYALAFELSFYYFTSINRELIGAFSNARKLAFWVSILLLEEEVGLITKLSRKYAEATLEVSDDSMSAYEHSFPFSWLDAGSVSCGDKKFSCRFRFRISLIIKGTYLLSNRLLPDVNPESELRITNKDTDVASQHRNPGFPSLNSEIVVQ